jgi:hypothetical protein
VLAAIAAVAATAVHDQYEFGEPSPQNTLPLALMVVVLLVGWYVAPDARTLTVRWLRIAALVLLIGGAVASVFPLPIWPWHPEQTTGHYIVHAVWAAALIALVVITHPDRPDATEPPDAASAEHRASQTCASEVSAPSLIAGYELSRPPA